MNNIDIIKKIKKGRLLNKLNDITIKKQIAIKKQQWIDAAFLRDKEKTLLRLIEKEG